MGSLRWVVGVALLIASASWLGCGTKPESQETEQPPAQETRSDETGTAVAALAGTRWQLVEIQSMSDEAGTEQPEDSTLYTLSFGEEGRTSLRLDCNRGTGTWTATPSSGTGGSLKFGPLAVTRAACPPPSLDQRIARDFEFVRSYTLDGGRLHLSLMADGGIYVWEPWAGDSEEE